MALQYLVQKGFSNFNFILGTGLKYGGGFALLTMAIIGTVAVDLVILSAAQKRHNSFLTGFIIGSMFSRANMDPLPLLVVSPITSVIAIALSLVLGVPGVGVGILLGWVFAASLLAVGCGLVALANATDPVTEYPAGSTYCTP